MRACITRDTAFEAWARLVYGVTGAPLAFRKEVRIENERWERDPSIKPPKKSRKAKPSR